LVGDKETEGVKKFFIKGIKLRVLLNIKLLLMYLKLSTFNGVNEVDKYLSAVNKVLETIRSSKFYKNNFEAVKNLLFKLTNVSPDGNTIPEKVPELDFLGMCVVLFYVKDDTLLTENFRPLATGSDIQKHLYKCREDYSEKVAAQLSTHLLRQENKSKLAESGTITDKSKVETYIKDSTTFIDRMLSSKKYGGKTMKKRRNLNKGGKTIRKMFKRTLKRGGSFVKKLTKRK
jgi:hypothetical protein